MGGMAAFIPSRKDKEVNERALAKVREDKQRESGQGFDGTWVAHPDLVPVAMEIFDAALGDKLNQKDKQRDDVTEDAARLLDVGIDGAAITRAGVENNVSVALRYIDAWLQGTGAVAIFNLMEDAATAEISRAQLWQWRTHNAKLADGTLFTAELYEEIRDEQVEIIRKELSNETRLQEATTLLDQLVLSNDFIPFLTIPGYGLLN
jgi:malate synthase